MRMRGETKGTGRGALKDKKSGKRDLNGRGCACREGRGLRGHVVHISRASCVSVLIVLLSVTAVWELLKEDRYRWRARPAGLRGAQREMCWALRQWRPRPRRRGPSPPVAFECGGEMRYSFLRRGPSRCSIQHGRLCEPRFCARTPACVSGGVQFFFFSLRQPSILLFPFAIRGSGIKPHCFYSISCHYQRRYDY